VDQTTVIIIGGGPAGAAAVWLRQFDIPAVLLEASDSLGGLQRQNPYNNNWLPGVQGKTGQEIAAMLHKHVMALGCPVRLNGAVLKVECKEECFTAHLQNGERLSGQFVVLATGTRPRSGGFTESSTVGIGPGLSMLRVAVAGKRVAILGAGDNAFVEAGNVLERGAESLTIFSRQTPRAQSLLQARIPPECVQIGPFTADPKTLTVERQKFDAIGVQFGFEPVKIPGLSLRETDGFTTVDRYGETGIKRVYACGDVTNFWHPCVATASAHGVQVARAIASALSAITR
jgi:thioredoxin reductase